MRTHGFQMTLRATALLAAACFAGTGGAASAPAIAAAEAAAPAALTVGVARAEGEDRALARPVAAPGWVRSQGRPLEVLMDDGSAMTLDAHTDVQLRPLADGRIEVRVGRGLVRVPGPRGRVLTAGANSVFTLDPSAAAGGAGDLEEADVEEGGDDEAGDETLTPAPRHRPARRHGAR